MAVVCPGYCATDLNHFSGPRTAEQGGESVTWPVMNDFESGGFYGEGKRVEYVQEVPEYVLAMATGY